MTDAKQTIPKWVKVLLRTVGTINVVALVLGTSFLMDRVYGVLTGRIAAPESAPYFRFAFAAMALVELGFVGVLLVTAVRFIQGRLSAVNLYSFSVLLLIVYFLTVGKLWLIGRGIGMSIAAATGVSSATAPFEFLFLVPFLYPVV
jgi:hypothetical protein